MCASMAIYHEHPSELQSALSKISYLKLIFKNSDSGITASVYIKLGEFIRDKMDDDPTKIDFEMMFHSVHYLPAPRNYIVIRIRERYLNNFLPVTDWLHVTNFWYMYKNVIELLPCSWKTASDSVRLMRYEVCEWECLD